MINITEDHDYINIEYQLPEHNPNATWWDISRNTSEWSKSLPEYSLFTFLQKLTGISQGYKDMGLVYYYIQTINSERIPGMRITSDTIGLNRVYSLETLISEIYAHQCSLEPFVSKAIIKLLKPMKYRKKRKTRKNKSASNKYGRRPIGNALRLKVFERDNYTCRMCGRNVYEHDIVLHVDHVNPVSNGGGNDITNLQTLCSDCNHGKHSKTYLKHDKRMKKYLKEYYKQK